MTRPHLLPVLIPCAPAVAALGSTLEIQPVKVQVVSDDALELLRQKRTAELTKRYGPIPSEDDRQRVRGILLLLDAIRAGDEDKRYKVAAELAALPWRWTQGYRWIRNRIAEDPSFTFSGPEISLRVKAARLILWQEKGSATPLPGLLCSNILEALNALVLFDIGPETTNCSCGAPLTQRRGNRRKFCSDRCRKRASRAAQQQK